jgi:hypothetical protein
MLVFIQEHHKGHRDQKVPNQDHGGIEVGVPSQEEEASGDQKEGQARQQHVLPAPCALWPLLDWRRQNLLMHAFFPLASLPASATWRCFEKQCDVS